MGAPSAPSGRALPAWPFLGLFWTFLLGWLVGLGGFVVSLWGVVMALYLILRGELRFPRAMGLWFVFLVLVVASGVMLDSPARAIGFLFRLGGYAAATAAFLYVYNAPDRTLPDRRVGTALTVFWVWIVVGGFLGVLWPEGGFTTPMRWVLPDVLVDNELVHEWVNPQFTEFQHPWGSPEAFARPSAPFAYTNNWGCNFAILVPFVVATIGASRGWRRLALTGLLLASVVPVVATLNRGMFLAMGIGVAYAIVRLVLRGKQGPLLLTAVGASVGAGAYLYFDVADRILLRTTYSTTNLGRAAIYREAFERTLGSPLLGWGGPRPSHTLDISVGTQGHVWNVMFSHGLLALTLFVATLCWFAWRTRRCEGIAFAAHVTLVMVAVAITFYGFDGPQMVVALAAAAIGMRQVDRRSRPHAAPRAGGPGAVRVPT